MSEMLVAQPRSTVRYQTELLFETQKIWNNPLFDDFVLNDTKDRHLVCADALARGCITLKSIGEGNLQSGRGETRTPNPRIMITLGHADHWSLSTTK